MLFVANWKMAMNSLDIAHFFTDSKTVLSHVELPSSAELVIMPSFPYLFEVGHWIRRFEQNWSLGAQNVSVNCEAASTGEVSPKMLSEFGVKYVCVGHSERRYNQNEDHYMIAQKLKMCIDNHLVPILCVGESLHDNQDGRGIDVILSQLRQALPDTLEVDQQICIAYEPIWAIGSGLNAQPEEVQNVLEIIDEWLIDRYDSTSKNVKLMYGGSVSSANAAGFVSQPSVDGLLIGGASLQAVSLIEILRICTQYLSQST